MNSCSLCEKIYLSEEKFNIYLCYDCHNKTSFCMNCDKIMSKIFNYINIFKCDYCNKVAPALSKLLVEMENQNDKNDINQINNIPNINEIKENNILYNNNFNFNTPNGNKIIFPLNINKNSINTPPTYSSFLFDIKNNTNLEKNEEKNTILNLSEINKNSKINKSFHLINYKNGKELLKDNKRNILYLLNKHKDKIN